MQKILFLLIIQVLLNGCLGSTYDTHDSFKMYIEAISLKDTNIKTYIIYDSTLYIKEKLKYSGINYFYYPEISTYLKNELEKQNYKVYKSNEYYKKYIHVDKLFFVNISSFIRVSNYFYEKNIDIDTNKIINSDEILPSWSIRLVVPDESFNFPYYIPSMIKCAGKYFNKNFKGIVTCKR